VSGGLETGDWQTVRPAMQDRMGPVRRLIAAYSLVGRPDSNRVRASLRMLSPASRGRGIGCSGHSSVPGVMDRLKGRWGPTIFLAEEPKKS